jgi:hypothetical protein
MQISYANEIPRTSGTLTGLANKIILRMDIIEPELRQLKSTCNKLVGKQVQPHIEIFKFAQSCVLLGKYYRADSNQAQLWLNIGLEATSQLLTDSVPHSESHRLYSELLMSKMEHKNILFQTKHSSALKNSLREAIRLDESNQRAQLNIALFERYAPKFYGGDMEHSIFLLEHLTASELKDVAIESEIQLCMISLNLGKNDDNEKCILKFK